MTVYFIRRIGDEGGPIKIGFSRDVLRRIREMTTASAEGFHLICQIPGGTFTERQIHISLDSDRIRGEWFRPSKRVLDLIERAKSGLLTGFDETEDSGRRLVEPEDEFSESIVTETRFYLNELVRREWQGMGDAIEDARDRVMRAADLEPSYGFRLWHKTKTMNDVSGSAYRALRLSYALALAAEGKLNDNQRQFLSTISGWADALAGTEGERTVK